MTLLFSCGSYHDDQVSFTLPRDAIYCKAPSCDRMSSVRVRQGLSHSYGAIASGYTLTLTLSLTLAMAGRPPCRLSVTTVCDVGGSGPHRFEILETNCTQFSPKFLMGFCSNEPCECIGQI